MQMDDIQMYRIEILNYMFVIKNNFITILLTEVMDLS